MGRGDVIEVPHGLTMIPIRGLTGSHAYAQGRTAGANAAGDDRTYDPVWVPWGLVAGDYTIGGFSLGETFATPWASRTSSPRASASRVRVTSPGDEHARQAVRRAGTLRLIGGQIHGGEGVKERCDFLAFAAKRGATLEDFAWMENIYSPPIGALFEPIAIAAQNGLADLRKKAAAEKPGAPGEGGGPGMSGSRRRGRSSACASRPSCTCASPRWTTCAAPPGATSAPHRPRGGAFWRYVFVPVYRRLPWETKQRAMHALKMTAEGHGWTPPARRRAGPGARLSGSA